MASQILPTYTTEHANDDIPLGKHAIELCSEGNVIRLVAALLVRLLPDPRFIIEFSFDESKCVLGRDSIFVRPKGRNQWEEYLIFSIIGDVARARPKREPVVWVQPRSKKLRSCKFHLINFPEFFSTGENSSDLTLRERRGSFRRLGAAEIRADDWQINIQSLPRTSELAKELKEGGGYAITHVGQVTKVTQRLFYTKEAKSILDGLRLFLSFARGAWVPTTAPIGFSREGHQIWEEFGTGPVSQWHYTPSWFDHMNGQLLSDVFPGFWNLYNYAEWKQPLSEVLYWYIRSNSSGRGPGIDGGLILTQAALELAAFVRLVEDERRMSRNHFKSRPTARNISDLLESLSIPAELPGKTEKLRELATSHSWQAGPHALTAVRNELVHPKRNLGYPLTRAVFEAWNLGQWYIELIVLRLAGHCGFYGNRISQSWRGEVEKVPWA